jgi:hypothetical protein
MVHFVCMALQIVAFSPSYSTRQLATGIVCDSVLRRMMMAAVWKCAFEKLYISFRNVVLFYALLLGRILFVYGIMVRRGSYFTKSNISFLCTYLNLFNLLIINKSFPLLLLLLFLLLPYTVVIAIPTCYGRAESER